MFNLNLIRIIEYFKNYFNNSFTSIVTLYFRAIFNYMETSIK